MQLPQSEDSIRKKHDSKAASGEIKTVVLEGQSLGIRLLDGKIVQSSLLRSFPRDLQKVGAEIQGRNPPLRPHPHGKGDGGLARAAG